MIASASLASLTVTSPGGGAEAAASIEVVERAYQLAQDLGYFKKYGVNVQLSTEQSGGVGAETAMVSGQVDMAGALVRAHDRLPAAGQGSRRRRQPQRRAG